MLLSDRIRAIREAKKLTQGDIETRTGLKRSYISRVENGHTVPSVETLEKFARALEVHLYQLFYEDEEPPKPPRVPHPKSSEQLWGSTRKEARELSRFRVLLARMTEGRRGVLFALVQAMAKRARPRAQERRKKKRMQR